MSDKHGHPHAGDRDRQVRQLEDLARLRAELCFLLEVDAVEVPVHVEVGLGRRRRAQLVHPLDACTRTRLIGTHARAREAGGVVQWLQHHRQRDRAAVRVGDDAVVLGRAFAVHLRDDERDAVLQAERRRLVDCDRAVAHGVRDELARQGRPDGEEADVQVRERLRRRLLDGDAADDLSG